MKHSEKLLYILTFIALAGCQKQHETFNAPEGSKAKPQLKSSVSDGDLVHAAAKDHTLPPYIRESAAVFEHVLDGTETNRKVINRAINEMAATRNERTCQIWISFMKACEAGLPTIFPALEEFSKLEKQAHEGNLKGVESNHFRYIGMIQTCIVYLTQFDMPSADREVAGLMTRFESRYGKSDVGKILLDDYRGEIKNATEDRKTGVVKWKLGRMHSNSPIE